MAKTLIAVFVMLSMLLLVIEQSNADCCPPYNEHNCADGTFIFCFTFIRFFFQIDISFSGTAITPCCGRGRCNIFCCNCDGGCRKATIRTSRERFLNRIAKSSVTKLDVHISINKLGKSINDLSSFEVSRLKHRDFWRFCQFLVIQRYWAKVR